MKSVRCISPVISVDLYLLFYFVPGLCFLFVSQVGTVGRTVVGKSSVNVVLFRLIPRKEPLETLS